MGIHSRDYIREPRRGGSFGGPSGQWAIRYLLIANIVVFLLQNTAMPVTGWLSLDLGHIIPSFELWRFVTYGFCHANIQHIFFNLFVLWMFGRAVEPIVGSREFLAFFLLGVIVSGACHVALQVLQGTPASVIGASGGVMAVVFLTAMIYPYQKVLLFFVIPIELRWLAVMYAAADVFGFIQGESTVAHAAHLGGAAFGVAYKYYNWRVTRWWVRLRSSLRKPVGRIRRPKVRLYSPSKDDLDEQVDAILAKIHKQGEASLTDRERQILKNASEQYKNR